MNEEDDAGSGAQVSLAWGRSSSVPLHDDWLTDAERRVRQGLAVPKRASDWRLGRWVGKEAVGRALGAPHLPPDQVEILASSGGAPVVTVRSAGDRTDVCISLSHAWGMGFAAAARGPLRIGCDVEAVRPRSDAFVSDYFTAPEAQRVRQAPPADQPTWANLVWSAKESALKALGEGLRLDTRAVEVMLTDQESFDGWRAFTAATPGGGTLHGHWRASGGFVWTFVTDVSVSRLDATQTP